MLITIDDLKKHRMCYLAAPYTKHPEGLEYAYKTAAAELAWMEFWGVKAYSPIAHWHTAAVLDPANRLKHSTPDEWFLRNKPMLDICDCLVIHYDRDNIESEGIAREAEYYSMVGKPIVDDFFLTKGRLRFTSSVGYA